MFAKYRRLLVFVATLVPLFHCLSDTAYGQHGQGCSCSACSRQARSASESANKFSVPSSSVAAATSSVPGIGQTVFLDFDSGTDFNTDYTQAIRTDVFDRVEAIYDRFGVNFVDSAPVSGPFSTITFNAGGPFGLAEGIDFGNQNQSDNATVNIAGGGATTDSDIAIFSANTAAHELGHLLGLRHRDAFGPIGSGLSAGIPFGPFPNFPGPSDAVETADHVLSTPAFGSPISRSTEPLWLSERSAIKLAAISQLITVDEGVNNDSIATAQSLSLGQLVVPNTIVSGQNAGIGDFDVDALSVNGTISSVTDVDIFSFQGEAGDLFNFEVMSFGDDNITNNFDSQISILDSDGNFVDYFGADAFNEDEIESADGLILDLVLPESGTYFIQIRSFPGDGFFPPDPGGDYRLFFSRFNGAISAVPEPASGTVLAVGGLLCGVVRRRRRSA